MSVLLPVLLAVWVFSASADGADKIRVGFAPGASSTALHHAQKKGFFIEEGLEADIIRM